MASDCFWPILLLLNLVMSSPVAHLQDMPLTQLVLSPLGSGIPDVPRVPSALQEGWSQVPRSSGSF